MLSLARFSLPALLAVAFALGPAAPARAEITDFQRFAIIAGGLTILGIGLSQANRGHAAPHARPAPVHPGPVYRPAPPRHAPVRVLPAYCLRQMQSNYRAVHVLPQRCLLRAGVHVHSLPQACRVHIRGRGPGYAARCLRHRGFVIG
jgi:hypothetical protein